MTNARKSILKGCASALALTMGLALAPQAGAVEIEAGPLDITVDTSINYNALYRVRDADCELIGQGNGGCTPGQSVNGDDGNLNYDPGFVSSQIRATHDIEFNHDFADAFVRFTYFWDPLNDNAKDTEFVDHTDRAIRQIGRDVRLLDAFVVKDFDVGNMPATVKVGNQVISWGESLFIPNGINAINPVDVSAIRSPGAELKNAFLPIWAANARIGLTRDLSLEAFYQFQWTDIEADPAGTYFSTQDFGTPGGEFAYLTPHITAQGDPEVFLNTPAAAALASPNAFGYVVRRGDDIEPDDSGQFGVALRYFADWLNQTEFGLYYINYHSRRPLVSGTLGDDINYDLIGGGILGEPNYASTAQFNVEYPEDIQLFGLSFNTQGPFGSALQGDFTYRIDQPIQLDGNEVLQAALLPTIADAAAQTGSALFGGAAAGIAALNTVAVDEGITTANATTLFGTSLDGYRLFDTFQAQVGGIKTFGPTERLGINQWVTAGEFGVTHVIDFADSPLAFEAPNTFGFYSLDSTSGLNGIQNLEGRPDETSMGYRVRVRADMLNAIGPWSLFPQVSWAHDISGTTPGPVNTFVENRATVNLSLTARYLENLEVGLAYQNFFSIGNDEYNVLRDRDFMNFNMKFFF